MMSGDNEKSVRESLQQRLYRVLTGYTQPAVISDIFKQAQFEAREIEERIYGPGGRAAFFRSRRV